MQAHGAIPVTNYRHQEIIASISQYGTVKQLSCEVSVVFRDIEQWRLNQCAVSDAGGVVAAQHIQAARAGGQMLQDGGNAVDAAIAAALALGSVEPWMCGLGGSGLMVVWLADQRRAFSVDFQGVLANDTHCDNYPLDMDLPLTLMGFPTVANHANTRGYQSITVPGAAAGFDHAISRWGSFSLEQVASPAIALAQTAPRSNWFTTLQCALEMEIINADSCSRDIYLPGSRPLLPGEPMHIPRLADTLARYARGGADEFYRGELARDLLTDLKAGGSAISANDFANYQVVENEAIEHSHRHSVLHTLGDASGGTRLGDFLREVQRSMPEPGSSPTPESWCHYAHALNTAWRAHNQRIGRGHNQDTCTSHLSAVDKEGNMVALTHTLLNRFGSGVTLPRTGLLMNNAVSYFDPRPGYPTTMQPGKRINASNICPVIATRNNEATFAIGASGGNHIMPAVAQVAALMLDFGLTLGEAMHHPRLDASDRDSVRADPALGQAVLDALTEYHSLEISQQLVFPKLYACVSGVAREHNCFVGLNDPTQPVGGASGPCNFYPGSDDTMNLQNTVHA
ncbi:MAG: gamma-glutamyltransferase [Granulosicoccus sp.]